LAEEELLPKDLLDEIDNMWKESGIEKSLEGSLVPKTVIENDQDLGIQAIQTENLKVDRYNPKASEAIKGNELKRSDEKKALSRTFKNATDGIKKNPEILYSEKPLKSRGTY
jgi:hypothetical protein